MPLPHAISVVVSAVGLTWSVLRAGRPRPIALAERLNDLPLTGAPVSRPVAIRWSDHQVPFIQADSDTDLAVALGMVHVHLRWTQMEVMRRLSQGRMAELLGPAAVDLDAVLRRLDPGAAAQAVLTVLPKDSRIWLDRFVAGINHAVTRIPRLPYEFPVLRLDRTPWTPADVLGIGRLAGADFAWSLWPTLLAARRTLDDWPDLWSRIAAAGTAPVPDAHGIVPPTARIGSNVVAVSGARAASGAGLLANDTHLPVGLPNPWILVGYRTQTQAAVGQMIPGIPVLAIGRSAALAWGGANLQSANSALVRAPAIADDGVTLSVRWGRPRRLTIRRADVGPILSDSPHFAGRPGETLALAWTGHRPTDDLTGLLALPRARTADAAMACLADANVPPLAMVCTTVDGAIGGVAATRLPRRSLPPADLVTADGTPWTGHDWLTAADAGARLLPVHGLLIHANNRIDSPHGRALATLVSADDRAVRLADRLASILTQEVLEAAQHDVVSPSARALTQAVLGAVDRCGLDHRRYAAILKPLADWDGDFTAASHAALAHVVLVGALLRGLEGQRAAALAVTRRLPALLIEPLGRMDGSQLAPILRHALGRSQRALRRHRIWGAIHRLRPDHPFARIPLLGRWFRTADHPADGSLDTVNQTAHPYGSGRHRSPFGAVSRFTCDLADPDSARAVLLGGQDGWLGSSTFADQIPLWHAGGRLPLPLTPQAVAAAHPHVTVIRPAQTDGASG